MKIAIIANLRESLLRAKLTPLGRLEDLEEILVVTDQAGPPLPKVRYLTPSRRLYRLSLHKALAKLLLLAWVTHRYSPEIIMAYALNAHGHSAWLVGKLFRKKIFQHLIGGFDEITVSANSTAEDNALIRNLPALRPIFRKINPFIVRHSDLLFVPGRNTKRQLMERIRIPAARIVRLHSTIDLQRFTPQPQVSPVPYDLITACWLAERKRVDLFLHAVRQVKEQVPGVRAAILGDGPLREPLRALARELGLEENLDFLGFRRDMAFYYRQARIFVLTSNSEGLSCACLEAMACGLPVVVSDVADMAEIARNNETGFLISNPQAAELFSTAILKLLEDESLYHKCSQKALRLIRRKHCFAAATQTWREILGVN